MDVEMWSKERLLVEVAEMYYLRDMVQADIAKQVGLDRTTISRMLKKAREQGVVQISVKSSFTECLALEKELKRIYGLKKAIVVPSRFSERPNLTAASLGQTGAEYLARIIKDSDILGLSWGTTLTMVADSLKMTKTQPTAADIIPLTGEPAKTSSRYHVTSVVSKVAQTFEAVPHYLYAPLLTEKEGTKETILADGVSSAVVNLWEKITKAFFSVGAITKGVSTLWWSLEFLDENKFNELLELGAVGEICAQYFDQAGRLIDTDLHKRTIAMPITRLKEIDFSVGIVGDEIKVPALVGALRGGFINVLITYEHIAEAVLSCESR